MRGDKLMEGVLFVWELTTQKCSLITHSAEMINMDDMRVF